MPDPDYLSFAKNGFPTKTTQPKKVIIIGAGMAGLVAGYELLNAGHEPIILEAQQRVGGRVQTLRDPFTHGLYAEAGAMRLPSAHTLTLAYVEKFKLKLNRFTMSNPNTYVYVNGKRYRTSEAQANTELLGFELAEHERGRNATDLFNTTLKPVMDMLQLEGEDAWRDIVAQYDRFSTREYLEGQRWSQGAIEMYGLLQHQEARMNASFVELLRAEIGHSFVDMFEIEGGTDNLPRAFLPTLSRYIRFGARMIAIDQSPTGVTIHYQTRAGRFKATGDYALITVPFSVLRHVETIKPFSRPKQRAIRQLHYDASAKVLLQSKRRFWEEDDGIFGGGSVTDLANRSIYYPDHGRETGRGVLLASYTWSEDAQRWGSLEPNDRIEQVIENVAQIHPQIVEEFEVGASKMWHDDEFAGGAFALFDPEQETQLQAAIVAPEGRVYFAGEHASVHHRWIQGAVESALRASWEIHNAPAAEVFGHVTPAEAYFPNSRGITPQQQYDQIKQLPLVAI